MPRHSSYRHAHHDRAACSPRARVVHGHPASDTTPAPHGREGVLPAVPQFTLFAPVDMTASVELRQQLQRDHCAVTYNDIVVKAVAAALPSFPTVNSRYERTRVVPQPHVDVGIVIATKGAQTFGSVQDADTLSLRDISGETRRLGQAAWDGELRPAARPPAFTVSNLGMYGVSRFSGYVVPHQAALLSVGAVEQRPFSTGGCHLDVRPVVELGLTCDHRMVSAVEAAFFLQQLGELLTVDIAEISA
jgi:pyruvate dehydrogenase E2 component (dihydrolipoamide acetyltransferase)